jgi:hypothetical protein
MHLAQKIDKNYKFPDLLWVVRDFTLQLVNNIGNKI